MLRGRGAWPRATDLASDGEFLGSLLVGVLGPKLYRLGLGISALLASEMADFWRQRRWRMARERALVAENAEYARSRAARL